MVVVGSNQCLSRGSFGPHPFHAQDSSETSRPADLWTSLLALPVLCDPSQTILTCKIDVTQT